MAEFISHELFVAITSGLVGVIVSTIFYLKYEARKEKKEAARLLFAYRFDLKGDEFSRAINQAVVVFHKDHKVIKLLNDFSREVRNGRGSDETLKSLFKETCAAAKIDISKVDDDYLMAPFNTRKY